MLNIIHIPKSFTSRCQSSMFYSDAQCEPFSAVSSIINAALPFIRYLHKICLLWISLPSHNLFFLKYLHRMSNSVIQSLHIKYMSAVENSTFSYNFLEYYSHSHICISEASIYTPVHTLWWCRNYALPSDHISADRNYPLIRFPMVAVVWLIQL